MPSFRTSATRLSLKSTQFTSRGLDETCRGTHSFTVFDRQRLPIIVNPFDSSRELIVEFCLFVSARHRLERTELKLSSSTVCVDRVSEGRPKVLAGALCLSADGRLIVTAFADWMLFNAIWLPILVSTRAASRPIRRQQLSSYCRLLVARKPSKPVVQIISPPASLSTGDHLCCGHRLSAAVPV